MNTIVYNAEYVFIAIVPVVRIKHNSQLEVEHLLNSRVLVQPDNIVVHCWTLKSPKVESLREMTRELHWCQGSRGVGPGPRGLVLPTGISCNIAMVCSEVDGDARDDI